MPEKIDGWIGVDLDGVLARHNPHSGKWDKDYIGDPIPKMIEKVEKALAEGKEIKIFTARVGTGRGLSPISGYEDTQEFADHQRRIIQDWTLEHLGVRLDVTAQKDWALIEIWDDRARQVVINTGEFVEDFWRDLFAYIYGRLGGG